MADELVKRLRSVPELWSGLPHGTVGGDLIREAADRIEALEAADAWLPIETAPHDNKPVLISGGSWLYSEGFADGVCDWVAIATFDHTMFGDHKWNGGFGSEYDGTYWHKPTHWRALPAPPASAKGDG